MSEALNHLAGRVAGDPLFLANPLAEYARSESLDDAGLAAALGCAVDDLARVRLCRAPRPAPDAFRADLAAVATRFGIGTAVLTRVVRLGQSLAELRGAPTATEPGFLLAARDGLNPPPGRVDGAPDAEPTS